MATKVVLVELEPSTIKQAWLVLSKTNDQLWRPQPTSRLLEK